MSSTSKATALSRSAAFVDAFQQHLHKLSPVERATFRAFHQSLTPESILLKVKAYDQAHNRGSASRKCAEKVDKSLRILNQFLASIAIAIQSNPDISSLIVGGLKLIVDLAVNYVTFFKKLTDMIDELFGYLATLREMGGGKEERKGSLSGSREMIERARSCLEIKLRVRPRRGKTPKVVFYTRRDIAEVDK